MKAQAITSSGFWVYLEVFRPAEYVFEDYFGAPRHIDAHETISSKIIICSAVLTVSGGFSTCWARFWGMFRWIATRWCSGDDLLANLNVPGGFSTRWVGFWGLFRCTAIPWCPGENFLANLSVSGGFSTRWARFRELFRCTSTRWNPEDDFDANRSLSHKFQTGGFFDWTFLRTVSVDGDTLMPRRRFTR